MGNEREEREVGKYENFYTGHFIMWRNDATMKKHCRPIALRDEN